MELKNIILVGNLISNRNSKVSKIERYKNELKYLESVSKFGFVEDGINYYKMDSYDNKGDYVCSFGEEGCFYVRDFKDGLNSFVKEYLINMLNKNIAKLEEEIKGIDEELIKL